MKSRLLFFAIFLTLFANAEVNDVFKKASTVAKNNSKEILNQEHKKLTIAKATIAAINDVRSKKQICSNPTTPLKWSEELYNIAKEHSIDMASNNMLSHEGSGGEYDLTAKKLGLKRGSHFYERVNQEKDSKKYLSGELVVRTGQNSFYSPKDVINYWVKINKDCKIIMDSRFSEVGLSKVISKKDNKVYWTLVLRGLKK